MRVLAVGAHPDDLELACGGTLVRYVNEGHDVVMCHVANGDAGSFVHSREQLAVVRGREAGRAAQVAGADHDTLGISDGEVNASDADQRAMVIDLVRKHRPDVIITHAPNDYHTDHNEVSRLVFDASFLATVPLIGTQRPHHATVTPLFYMETYAGMDFVPDEFVDISAVIDTKIDMFTCHASQIDWLRDHVEVDLTEVIRTVARFRGLQCQVEYAEAFALCRRGLRGTTRRLLP